MKPLLSFLSRSLALFLLVPLAVQGQGGHITTIAGNGVTQYIGDGWPATSYSLAMPYGVCVDRAGNVFSTDFASYRVRRIVHDSIFTYAGTGMPGYTGDGAAATAATLHNPYAITVDTGGNVYVLEQYNDVVRKIDKATGVITTICGTGMGGFYGEGVPGLTARMEQPSGLCMDKAGNLYIADRGNQRVRMMNMTTGIINTVAGTGTNGFSGDGAAATSANLSYPTGLCMDTLGNLYIADNANHRIRKVDAVTGIITTVAGTGTPGFSGNGGPAVDAQLLQPNSIFMSRKGFLYISDFGNNVIRIMGPDGGINNVVGSGGYGYSGDGGPAPLATMAGPMAVFVDDSDNIYVADGGNSAIRKVQYSPVGISSVTRLNSLPVYPNPTTGVCFVDAGAASGNATIVVCNTLGAVVYSAAVTSAKQSIDISMQPAGIYYVRLLSGNEVKVGKVVKE